MNIWSKNKFTVFVWSFFGVAWVSYLVSSIKILLLPVAERVKFVPDDTYYYLQVAKNWATHGFWTFDGGVSVTSGFNKLHAFYLGWIYTLIRPSDEAFVTIAMLTSFVLTTAPILFMAWSVRREKYDVMPLVLGCFLLAGNLTYNAVGGTEFGWVILFSTMYIFSFSLLGHHAHPRAHWWMIYAAFMGVMTRMDFLILPIAIWCATVAISPDSRLHHCRAVFYALLAGLVAVLISSLHTYWITGDWTQDNIASKFSWGGGGVRSTTRIIVSMFTEPSWWTLGPLVVVGWVMLRQFFIARDIGGHDYILWGGLVVVCLLGVLSYVFVSGDTQTWYSAIFYVPLYVAIGMAIHYNPIYRWTQIAATLLLATAIGGTLLPSYRFDHSQTPPYPWQDGMYVASQIIRQENYDNVGAWNAGIIGYYSGKTVINLDGLMNHSIRRTVHRESEFYRYLHRHVAYVMDNDFQFHNPGRQLRGHYDNHTFLGWTERLVVRSSDMRFGYFRMLAVRWGHDGK